VGAASLCLNQQGCTIGMRSLGLIVYLFGGLFEFGKDGAVFFDDDMIRC